ncbi:MAG: hypothetical protein EDM03_12480 [Porphyrobacter sp. IPPAS B-1204]|nr:MAG: hypothetical protein EDM03_12480 [Porphyrobacter sp. IPPAS B-1204]
MARGKRASAKGIGGKRGKAEATPPTADNTPTRTAGLPLPSPVAGTNLVIADIVLRAAGGLLRDQMEKGLLRGSYDKTKVDKLIHGRGLTASVALWGASHLARRSPLGLAVVAGGLAAKVFYDRGKRLEAKRRAKQKSGPES